MQPTRREFLTSTALVSGALLASGLASTGNANQPDRKLNIACVGVGGAGGNFLRDKALAAHNFIAFAEVDDREGKKIYDLHPDVPRYKDYRVMMEKHGKEIDAVIISTPDHSHYHTAKYVIERGRHVYCQKPLTRTLWECHQLRELGRANPHIITQMGNQGHSLSALRMGVEWIQAGVIGDVTEVHMWTGRSGNGATARPEPEEVPAELDWDLWLGSSPHLPYSSKYAPKKWRGWWDFGCGPLGDIGCHTMDMPHWALKLGTPKTVSAKFSGSTLLGAAKASVITYEFDAREGMPPVKLLWHSGKGNMPPRPKDLEENRELPIQGGAVFYGTKGTILAPGMRPSSIRLIPESKMQEVAKAKTLPEPWIPRIDGGHFQDWLNGILSATQPGSSFCQDATSLTEMALLGNLALQTGKTIRWDPEKLEAKGLPEAEPFIKPPYREEWLG
jgi:predicted dehydrogenase